MATYINQKDVVTTKSDHVAPGANPGVSPSVPTPPAGPVPTPFFYVAKSSSGTQVSGKVTINKGKALTSRSVMDIEIPGNQPSQPVGAGDLVTHAIEKKAHPMKPVAGVFKVLTEDHEVCATADMVALNVLTGTEELCQSIGAFMGAGDFAAKLANGTAGDCVIILTAAEPVSVASGDVVDEALDLDLPGLIPVALRRYYSTARLKERTPLGVGGFTHSYHQYVEAAESGLVLRDETTRDLRFPALEPRAEAYHRGARLTLTRGQGEAYTLTSAATGLTREYAPLAHGGRSMLRRIRDGWGNRVELVYEDERLARVVDTAGRELCFSHDAEGRITRVDLRAADETFASVIYAYTDAGELASATDPLGHAERYAWDGHHRMVDKTRKNGVHFRYRYDPETGRCTKAWGDGGLHGFDFDHDLKKGVTVAHANPQPRRYTWNAEGAVVREETLDGGFVIAREYDDDQHLLSETNAAGETWAYTYDARGNRLTATDGAGNVTLWEYQGDLLVRWIDPDGGERSYAYDGRGALIGTVDRRGARTALSYDAHGRLTAIHGPERSMRFEHDAQHNVIKTVDWEGGAWTSSCDALGRCVARTDPLGGTSRFEMDAMGHVTAVTGPDGATISLAYDALEAPIRYTDPTGRVSTFEYAGTGLLRKMTLPGDLSWEFVYDVNEQLRAVKNPKRETYEYRYDRAGRVVESTSFDGRSTRYQQGKNGRITRAEYADGSHRAFSYDERGHLVGESSPHGARIFERNAMGQITKAIVEDHYGTVEVELEHDESGRIISTTSNGATIRYELDELKRRVARVLPGGETTRFSYDATGIAGIDHRGHKLWIQRDARGREVRKVLYDSGAEIVTSYDPLDRPAEQWVLAARAPGGGAPRVLVQRKWSYDPRHHVQRLLDRRWGAFDYSHDEAGRLVGAAGARTAERFDYDAAGSVIGSGGAEPWAMRAGNVLVRTPAAEYEVDERGRRTKKIALRDDRPSGEITRYYWDCRDQLREVDLPDGRRVIYCYDAFGRRVRKEILPPRPDPTAPPGPPRIIQYLWDGDTLAAEVDSERGTRVFVMDQAHLVPLIHEEQGEVFVYTHDQVFTPKELIGEDGAVAWSAAHSPWGRVLAEEQPAGKSRARPLSSPFRLLGQYHDEETGLCYTRFRYFDPETVRWLSPDPIAMLGGMNLFAFNGNPTSSSDLLGLGPCAGYGWIKFHTDAHGRPVGVTAIVTKDMILMGQEPAGSIKPDGFGTLPGVNARGHLLANMLGGPGEGTPGTANLVTLRQSPTNHPGMTQQEWAVRNNVEANGPALYDVHVTYPPGSTTGVAPTSVTMQGFGSNGQGILVDPTTGAPTSSVTIPN